MANENVVLMSIKPEYARQIMAGTKRFEFRRKIFTQKVETIVVYASSPLRKVIGRVAVKEVHAGTPEAIWEKCQFAAGISKDAYFKYFNGRRCAFAIEVADPIIEGYPVSLESVYRGRPPQSYCYLKRD